MRVQNTIPSKMLNMIHDYCPGKINHSMTVVQSLVTVKIYVWVVMRLKVVRIQKIHTSCLCFKTCTFMQSKEYLLEK